MGWLRSKRSGLRVPLESLHLVGRGPRSALLLTDSRVSHEHASLRWDGGVWTLRDLGSLNRTTSNGQALAPGEVVSLPLGARIVFGSEEECWILEDDGPPQVMAVPLDGGIATVAEDGLLPLPSAENPLLTIYRAQNGTWTYEDGSASEPLTDQAIIQAGPLRYRFCLPQITSRTTPVSGLGGLRVSNLHLEFLVSSDLEHIEILARAGEATQKLGARSHNELLLLLARARRNDQEQGLPAPSCGWLSQDEVARMMRLDPEHLNVQIFRIRRQFAELGLVDPGQIVERRPKSRQMRFGGVSSSETRA
jgi:hypothetical protein